MYYACRWRDASPPVAVFGIPLPFTLIYLFWCPFPSGNTIFICTLVLGAFVLLGHFGWRLQVLLQRLVYLWHGSRAAGRPWWYRHFTEATRRWSGL
ncbi:conjugal transfer protein [Salmonella enterica]|nr:conjugal transfer protein [Salmonella enterica]